MPGPIPRRVSRSAHTCFFLRVLGLPQQGCGSAYPLLPANTIFRGAYFRGCRHSFMFKPPSLLASQIVPTPAHTAAGQLRLLRLSRTCFVTSACIGSGRRWRIGYRPTLATVRRSNRVCRFPAHGFHEDSNDRDAREGINPTRLTSPYSR